MASNPTRRQKLSPVSKSFLKNESFLKKFISRYMTRPEDIDDVVQESFLKAFAAESEKPIAHPKAFLFRIARNSALSRLRLKSRSITDYIEDLGSSDVVSTAAPVEDQIADQEKLAVFAEAAASLPPQCRRAFLLRKVNGLSHREVAERLGISISTVEKHQAAGLARCSQYMRLREHSNLAEGRTSRIKGIKQ
jgi:RNA polymerase sigma-70 factor (ECF subfamily)